MQGRGLQGAKSPLLWEDEQVQEYLAGSPLIGEIKERLKVCTRNPAMKLQDSRDHFPLAARRCPPSSFAGMMKRRSTPGTYAKVLVCLCRGLRGSMMSWTPYGIWRAACSSLTLLTLQQRPSQ